MFNKKSVLIGITLLALAVSAYAGVAAAQDITPSPEPTSQPPVASQMRTLSVSGNGKVYMTPDIASIYVGVHTEGKDAAAAIASNNDQAQEVIDAVKRAGVEAKDIQTTNFSIYPQQQFDPQGRPTGEITYVVDNTVLVMVRNIDGIGDLLDATVAAGANSINGIQFDVADKTAYMADARKAAIADARAQAGELAQAAGVTLGEVVSINAYTSGYPIPVPYGKGGVMMEAAASVPVNPGQSLLSIDVNVVFEIQ